MNLKKIKLEIFYLRKAFFEYRSLFSYLWYRFVVAPKILNTKKDLSRPINTDNLSIHILCCRRDLIMLFWSLGSYYANCTRIGLVYLHNDGSLNEAEQSMIKKYFPDIIFIGPQDVLNKNISLPEYPKIIEFRKSYQDKLFVKKIVDSYLVSNQPSHLLFDSDLIWFNDPAEIWQQLETEPAQSLMMDNGQTRNYVTFIDGGRLQENLAGYNAGIIYYKKNNFNLNKLQEYFFRFDVKQSRNFYFLEQAGHSYCLDNLNALPVDFYTIKGKLDKLVKAKHFTSPRRPLFYLEGIEKLKEKLL